MTCSRCNRPARHLLACGTLFCDFHWRGWLYYLDRLPRRLDLARLGELVAGYLAP